MTNPNLICSCGFKFAGPSQFRNCGAFITKEGHSGVICPKCKKTYVDGKEVKLRKVADDKE